MRSFRADYSFGMDGEQNALPKLRNYLQDPDLVKTVSQYAPFDFESTSFVVELKTRICRSGSYPTTLVPYSKILAGLEEGRKVVFAFQFTDGLFVIPYDVEKFKDFKVEPFKRDARVDKVDVKQLYCFIPTEALTKVCDYSRDSQDGQVAVSVD